jgi:hypothetical protein
MDNPELQKLFAALKWLEKEVESAGCNGQHYRDLFKHYARQG